MPELAGRVAIVTGGGSGLGEAIARSMAAAGASVALFEINPESGEATAESITAEYGVDARAYTVDVADRASVEQAVADTLSELGRLDILVNNAGVSHVGPHTQDVTDDEWFQSINVMQTGVFFCTRAVAKTFLGQRSGAVVNISSIRGFSPNVGRLSYCAPKAAVLMMTKVTAAEWAGHGVRVNAISPGVQHTPMWDADVARGAIDNDFYVNLVPMKRLGEPHEVGELAVFLCSDRAGYITGSNVTIDGALTSIPAG
jgi:NAD(P)-dependent dehydrogenase (short-subunit alcohol dehydrogenase family)